MTPNQPSVVSNRHRVPPLVVSCSGDNKRTFTIDGFGDHVRPDWPLTITGMRRFAGVNGILSDREERITKGERELAP
jgi:hypothetical protein